MNNETKKGEPLFWINAKFDNTSQTFFRRGFLMTDLGHIVEGKNINAIIRKMCSKPPLAWNTKSH